MTIRRKSFLALGGVAASATLLAACGGDSDDTDVVSGTDPSDAGGAEGDEEEAPVRADADLVIWADQLKADSLADAAEAWGQENGLTVAVQPVSGDLQGNFVTANESGNGPDVLVAAHDWIGNLVQNSSISPVPLPADAEDAIAPIGLTAVTYEGQTYGVPYAVEALALFANTALTDNPTPETIEELVAAGEAGGADEVLALQVDESGDAYHMQPLYTSGGGYLFGTDADGNLDPSDVGVGKEGSIEAAKKIGELGEQGVLKTSITGSNSISLFANGTAAYLVSGPWAIAEIETAGLDYEMSAVPGFEGMEPARPFAGVNAFFLASNAANPAFAQQLVSEIASNPEIPEAMFAENQLPPVNLELQERLAAENPELVRIAEFAEEAEPMPSIPAMAAVWGPLGQAQAAIVGGADPESTIISAGEEIVTQIG